MLRRRRWFIGTSAPVLQQRSTSPRRSPRERRSMPAAASFASSGRYQVRFVIRLVRFTAGTGGHPQNWQGWRTYSRMGGAAPGRERARAGQRTNGDQTVAIATMPNTPSGLPHEGPQVLADDAADRELLANVHPLHWTNP